MLSIDVPCLLGFRPVIAGEKRGKGGSRSVSHPSLVLLFVCMAAKTPLRNARDMAPNNAVPVSGFTSLVPRVIRFPIR